MEKLLTELWGGEGGRRKKKKEKSFVASYSRTSIEIMGKIKCILALRQRWGIEVKHQYSDQSASGVGLLLGLADLE